MVTRRVLVTGATGGLGRVLVPALRDKGFEVVATGRRREIGAGLTGDGVTFHAADLARDALVPLMAGVDTVFHLAALSAPWGPRAAFVEANVTATQRVLDAAAAGGCCRFIHVSTPSIYTDTRHQIGLTEASPLPARWVNDYAETKHAGERLVVAAARPAMATVVLRPRAIVGPFDSVLLPRLLRAGRHGTLVLPEGGAALVELSDARDVVSALLAARERAPAVNGAVFNISGGAPLPLAEVAALVFRTLGQPLRIRSISASVALRLATFAEAVARALPGRPEPPLTRYSAMVASWSQTFDLAAARTGLQWQPTHSAQGALAWALAARRHA